MSKSKWDAVCFDFDGTIADTSLGVKRSILYALNKKGIPVGDPKNLDRFLGPPLYESFSKIYGVEENLSETLVNIYREYYNVKGKYELEFYPGMPELIKTMVKQDIPVAVVSSKPKVYLDQILKHFHMESFFHTVVGPELENKNSNKERLVRKAISNMNLNNTKNILMVGDRFYDIQGAKDAGISSAAVTFGFGDKEELEAVKPDFIVDDSEALSKIIL